MSFPVVLYQITQIRLAVHEVKAPHLDDPSTYILPCDAESYCCLIMPLLYGALLVITQSKSKLIHRLAKDLVPRERMMGELRDKCFRYSIAARLPLRRWSWLSRAGTGYVDVFHFFGIHS